MNAQTIKMPRGASSLQRTGHRLVKTGWKLFGDVQYCVSRRELGDALAEDTAQDLWNMAEHLMTKMGELLHRPVVLDPGAPAVPPPRLGSAVPARAEPRAAARPKATPPVERRAVVREEPAPPPMVMQAPEPIIAPPFVVPPLEPPPPAPPEAARGEPAAPDLVLSIEEAERRRIDHLCADYEPRPPAVRPLCSPLPRDWREDPTYVVNDPLLLGAGGPVPQRGTIGRDFRDGFRVSLNLSEPFCLSAFSLPGAGKSYLLSLILQMGVQPLRYLNELSRPACGIVFHSDKDAGYLPEALSCVEANFHPEEVRHLMENYGALPEGMREVVLLCPLSRVEEMRARHPHCRVHPILFSLSELGMAGLRVLLGLRDGAQSLYVRVLGQLLQRLGDGVTLDRLWEAVEAEPLLNAQQRKLIQARLSLVRPLIDDRWPLRRVLRPGRIVVVDVRDPWMAQADVSLLFALLSSVLVQRPEEGQDFLKLVCFGEAHKHFGSPELAGEIERIARQRRHLLVGLLIESQDPLSIPRSILSLSDMLAIGKMSDEAWVKHLCKANDNLRGLQVKHTTPLRPGYLWLWAERTYTSGDLEKKEHEGLHLVRIRPQVAQHGGHTRTALPS